MNNQAVNVRWELRPQTCSFELVRSHMRKHTLAPHAACGFRGSSGPGHPCCQEGTRVHPLGHPPQSYVSSMGGHAGCTCRLMLQPPEPVPALAKPLSLPSASSMWLLLDLIVPSGLLFVFWTKVLDYRGTAGCYFCLH